MSPPDRYGFWTVIVQCLPLSSFLVQTPIHTLAHSRPGWTEVRYNSPTAITQPSVLLRANQGSRIGAAARPDSVSVLRSFRATRTRTKDTPAGDHDELTARRHSCNRLFANAHSFRRHS